MNIELREWATCYSSFKNMFIEYKYIGAFYYFFLVLMKMNSIWGPSLPIKVL